MTWYTMFLPVPTPALPDSTYGDTGASVDSVGWAVTGAGVFMGDDRPSGGVGCDVVASIGILVGAGVSTGSIRDDLAVVTSGVGLAVGGGAFALAPAVRTTTEGAALLCAVGSIVGDVVVGALDGLLVGPVVGASVGSGVPAVTVTVGANVNTASSELVLRVGALDGASSLLTSWVGSSTVFVGTIVSTAGTGAGVVGSGEGTGDGRGVGRGVCFGREREERNSGDRFNVGNIVGSSFDPEEKKGGNTIVGKAVRTDGSAVSPGRDGLLETDGSFVGLELGLADGPVLGNGTDGISLGLGEGWADGAADGSIDG